MIRLLDLMEPPKVGETYLVPTMLHEGKDIPLVGVMHNDKELGVQDIDHIHVDVRFANADYLIKANFSPREARWQEEGHPLGYVAAVGFYDKNNANPIIEKPMTCVREDFPMPKVYKAGKYGHLSAEVRHIREKKGITHLNMKCKVCPHKGTNLDNVKPKDGVILCPAHGMEFNAETGEIIQF